MTPGKVWGQRNSGWNVAFRDRQDEQYYGDGRRWGVQIAYSYEGARAHGDIVPRPLGSAGGMREIQDFSGFDETTIVLCGDALIDLDIGAALQEHKEKGAIASVVTLNVPLQEVKNYGIVVAGEDGRVESFQEKPSPQNLHWSTLASTGIYLFSRPRSSVFRRTRCTTWARSCPQPGQGRPAVLHEPCLELDGHGRVSSYWSVLQRVLRGDVAQMKMPGREVRPGVWVGINTRIPWDQVDIKGPVCIGSSVSIEPGVSIVGPAWIGHGCTLRAKSTVRRGIACSIRAHRRRHVFRGHDRVTRILREPLRQDLLLG